MHCDMRYKAVIFDMDGTILDTSEDLAAAINYALAKFGHRGDFPVEDVCLFFGSGAHTAVQRALAREAGMSREEILEIGSAVNGAVPGIDEEEVQRILEVYQPYYKAHNAIRTCAYPGIRDLLVRLREAGVLTAVVSNKPDNSVTQLAEDYFDGLFDLAIGETAGIARKPAPDMNYLILDKLGVSAERRLCRRHGDRHRDCPQHRNGPDHGELGIPPGLLSESAGREDDRGQRG